uniref:RNA ligase 1 n=1 Tax=Neogobius melanostomus TaxID=47308 RepID=A0A8C6S3S1_9GOBI
MRLLFRTMSPVIRVVFSPRRRRTPSRDQALSQTRFAKINEIFLSSNIFTAVLFDAGTGSRMRRLGSVQQKMPCVFTTEVKEEPSRKRDCQSYKVVATETLNPVAMDADVESALATEKVDGTCCYVSLFRGQPYLWARLDRKPNKQAEKRFKKHLHLHRSGKGFSWNVAEDFKTVPETWIPAHGVKHLNDQPLPDENGHIPGWLPVDRDSKQYCWHSSVVDYELRAALVLRPTSHNHQHHHQAALELRAVPLNELLEQTLELIGTNVNGNPYAAPSSPGTTVARGGHSAGLSLRGGERRHHGERIRRQQRPVQLLLQTPRTDVRQTPGRPVRDLKTISDPETRHSLNPSRHHRNHQTKNFLL